MTRTEIDTADAADALAVAVAEADAFNTYRAALAAARVALDDARTADRAARAALDAAEWIERETA